jgi:tyrosine-protein kinase Etk/Wzc
MSTETLIPPPHTTPTGADVRMPAYEKPEEDGNELSLLDLLLALAERRRLVLGITFGFAIVSALISLILPLRYTAKVVLMAPEQQTSMGAALSSQLGNLSGMAALAGGGLGLKNPNDMYVSMLKSRTVEDAMVQRFGLMQEFHQKLLSGARDALESHTTIDGSGKDSLIRLSLVDKDPKRAAELANGYIEEFRNLTDHLAISEAAQRRLFFEQQLKASKDNLASAEEALKKTMQSTGMIQLDSQARALIESAAQIRAQIAEREVQIEGMQTYATSENAQLVQAQKELAGLKAQLAALGGDEDSPLGGMMVPKGKVPEASLEYIRAYRNVKYQETIFEIIARQFEAAKLDEAKEGAPIQVIDWATAPDRRSFPKRGLIVLGATVFGFIVSAGVVWFQSSMRRLRSDPETNRKLDQLRGSVSFRKQARN